MGRRDIEYSLKGLLELDDAYITIYGKDKDNDSYDNQGNKRGRGSERKRSIVVMAKTELGRDNGNKLRKSTALK